MMKGVSPVVAVVLLIAIAVIAAVGVWYWVGGMANKPPMAETTQRSIVVTSCNQTHVMVRNNGGVAASKDADIYSQSGVKLGYLPISESEFAVSVGNVTRVPIYNETGDQTSIPTGAIYTIIDGDYPEITFSC